MRAPLPRDIAFVFQENALFPWCTVIENVKLGMVFQGVPKAEQEARAQQVARSGRAQGLHAATIRRSSPAACASARRWPARSACETGILLMDEPFGALDEQTRMILGEDLSVLLSRTEKTIVFVTHSLGEAVFLADRVAVFSARPGTIKEIIAVDEPHPRKPAFVTTEKFSQLRNTLYGLLHDEIRKAVEQSAMAGPRLMSAAMSGETTGATSSSAARVQVGFLVDAGRCSGISARPAGASAAAAAQSGQGLARAEGRARHRRIPARSPGDADRTRDRVLHFLHHRASRSAI